MKGVNRLFQLFLHFNSKDQVNEAVSEIKANHERMNPGYDVIVTVSPDPDKVELNGVTSVQFAINVDLIKKNNNN